MTYAYIRVSSLDQNIDRQMMEIEKFNISSENIYIDYVSGKNFDRKNYQILKSRLKENDVLYIKSIDRLGRSYKMITEEWRYLTHIRVSVFVIDMPILNTKISPNSLMNNFINDLVLQILSFVAQNEWDLIRTRQKEGIEAARLKGKHLGRPFLRLPDNFDLEVEKYSNEEQSLTETLERLHISESSFYKYSKHLRKRRKQK